MPDPGQITRPPRRRRSYLGFSAMESLIVQREITLNVDRNRKMQNELSHGFGVLSFQTELQANDFKYLLQCMSPVLAQSGHHTPLNQCPLLGVNRTLRGQALMSAFDPKRTWVTTSMATLPRQFGRAEWSRSRPRARGKLHVRRLVRHAQS